MKLLLLLCLGLTLVCADHGGNDVVTRNFNMSKISGEWYSILLASDTKEKIEGNGSMRIFVNSIQVLHNCSLSLKYNKKVYGECTKISFICEKTTEDGVCRIDYEGCNKFHIIEVVYSHYLIVHVLNRKNDKETQVMALYARKPNVRPKLKERFGDICQQNGIGEENILDLTDFDRCLHARWSHVAKTSRFSEERLSNRKKAPAIDSVPSFPLFWPVTKVTEQC